MATKVQSNSSTATTTVALTGVAAGNLIVLLAQWEGNSANVTVSDGTTSLTVGTRADGPTLNNVSSQFAYLLSANGGNKTYTVTFPSGTVAGTQNIIVIEFNATGAWSFDTQNTGSGTNTTGTTGNITTTGTDEVVCGGTGINSSAQEPIATFKINAVAADGSVTASNAGNPDAAMWYRLLTSTFAGGNASCTYAGVADEFSANIIAFKAATTASGATIGAARIATKFVGPAVQRFLFRQPPLLDTTVAPPTSQAVMQRPAGTRLVGPPVLRRGLRVFTPLDTTTTPSAAVIVATVGSYTFAGKASGLSAQINAALGAYTWQGKASPLSTQIRAALGAYTWQGRTSPLSAQIGATTGAYSWQGRASPLSAQIGATVAPYTWHGVAGTVTTLPTINATVGAYAFSGSAAQVQGGADVPAPGGAGGGGQQTYEEWLARHPWLRDYELRPNWYAYPPEKKKLRKQIVAAAKERKAVERRLSFAKDRSELDKLLEILNTLQERYNALQELYRAGLAAWQQSRAAEAEEEAEFMEHLINLL